MFVSKAKRLIVIFSLFDPERPDAPEDLSVYTGSSREVTVHWSAAFNGNSPVTAYIVQAKRATGKCVPPERVYVCVRVCVLFVYFILQANVKPNNWNRFSNLSKLNLQCFIYTDMCK